MWEIWIDDNFVKTTFNIKEMWFYRDNGYIIKDIS